MSSPKPPKYSRPGGRGSRTGVHGGQIEPPPEKWTLAEIERRGKAAHERWLVKIGYKPAPPAVDEAHKAAEREAEQRQQDANALEAALQRTPYGRQMLDLLAEGAHLRIYEALASDLVRGAAEDLDRLRRALMGRDLLARERAAARIPAAEAELLKWQRALENYRYRREYLEAALAYGMQAFT